MKIQQKLRLLMAIALIITLIPVGTMVKAEGLSPFTDVSDDHWGLQHIFKMERRGIITGYGNGEFKPSNSVSQLEAVVMAVRAMGLEDEAKTIDTSIVEAWQLDLPSTWNAVAYVAMAEKQGLITKNDFNPSQNASRSWIAILMIKMIGAEDEVDPYATTSFFDDHLILPWAKKYVALAVEKELITGYYDKDGNLVFAPNASVTRAQLATMISRADRYMEDVKGQLPVAKVVQRGEQQVTLLDPEGVEKTYPFAYQVLFYDQEGKRKTTSELSVNQMVRYALNNQNRIDYLELVSSSSWEDKQVRIKGTIAQLFGDDRLITLKDENGKLTIYPYAEEIKVTNSYHTSLNMEELHIGDEVNITLNGDNVIVALEVLSPSATGNLEGSIYSLDVDAGIITLKSSGQYIAYPLAEDVYVEYEGIRFPSIKDLQVGDQVVLELADEEVQVIRVQQSYQKDTLEGKIITISLSPHVLTLRLDNGQLQAYEVADDAEIVIKGKDPAYFEDLKVDDMLQFTAENGQITSLEVTNREVVTEMKGVVKSIDQANGYITLENDQKALKTFTIDPYVKVDYDDDLDAIEVGMKVTVQLRDNLVYAISTNSTVEGTFVEVDRYLTFITVEEDNKKEVYRLANDVDVNIIDVSKPSLADLENGQSIHLYFDQDVVTRIDAIKTDTYMLDDVNKSRSRITVAVNGDEETYRLYSFTSIVIPEVSEPTISDLTEGETVQLTFTGNYLTKVEVVPPVYGKVQSIETYREVMVITTEAGDQTIDLDQTVTVYNSNHVEMSLNNLQVGDYIQLVELTNELIITQAERVNGTFIALDADKGRIYLKGEDGEYLFYNLAEDVQVFKGTTRYYLGDLQADDAVSLYLFDDEVAEIILDE